MAGHFVRDANIRLTRKKIPLANTLAYLVTKKKEDKFYNMA
jgi:hypothetical protein